MHPHLPLNPTQIDVWHIPLPETDAYLAQLNTLTADEQARYHRFYFAPHKRRFAQARLALKHILSLYLNCPQQTIQLLYQTHGKPYLNSPTQIKFNLSHSQNSALLAVGQCHEVGIDIEHFSSRPFHGIAEHMFSLEERDYLQNAPSALLPMRFFSIWSRKEAFIKANGLGLRYQTESINLLPDAIDDPLLNQSWLLKTFFPSPAFAASLCYHPAIQIQRTFHYDPAQRNGYHPSTHTA